MIASTTGGSGKGVTKQIRREGKASLPLTHTLIVPPHTSTNYYAPLRGVACVHARHQFTAGDLGSALSASPASPLPVYRVAVFFSPIRHG